MRRPRFALVTLLCTALVAASCGRDTPTAPPAPANDLLGSTAGTLSNVTGTLLKCKKLPEYTNSAVIGKSGGTLQVGPHLLTIPKNALSSDVLISADAPSDNNRTVNFQPEGLQFSQPASLTMSYAGCSLVVGLLPQVAYVSDDLAILYYLPSVNNFGSQTVTGQIQHFSGYATAW